LESASNVGPPQLGFYRRYCESRTRPLEDADVYLLRLRRRNAQRYANKRADDNLSSALATLALLLEVYFERELNLAFHLGGTRKEAKVGVRYGVIWLSRTLIGTKGRLD